MKYKHVFFIWLLADIFLAVGFLLYAFIFEYDELSKRGSLAYDFGDIQFLLLIILSGFLGSIFSLITMLIFQSYYLKSNKGITNYKQVYTRLIIIINLIYFFIGCFIIDINGKFILFFISSTLTGLLAFYLVDKKIALVKAT